MKSILMRLRVLLPFKVFLDNAHVLRIIAETPEGSFGILPHRQDCVAALTAGILIYETAKEGESYLAVDEGVLVKKNQQVLVSVRRVIEGRELEDLRDLIEENFLKLNDSEQQVRSVTAKLESGLIRRLAQYHRD